MSSRKIGLNLVVIVALAALFTGIWALYNRPVSVPDWPERISGFSFSPFRLNQNPQSGRYPSAEPVSYTHLGSTQGDTRQEHTPAFHIIDSINALTRNDSMPEHRIALSTGCDQL